MWHGLVVGGGLCRGHPWDKTPGAAQIMDKASSKKDLAKTEPSSNAGDISVKTHLKSNRFPNSYKRKEWGKRAQETALQTLSSVMKEGPGVLQELEETPLQPMESPYPSRLLPCSPGRPTWEQTTTLQQGPVPWRKLQHRLELFLENWCHTGAVPVGLHAMGEPILEQGKSAGKQRQ